MAHPVEVNDSNFSEFVRTNSVAVVDFWAPWCGPCLRIAPIVEQLSNELEPKVTFGKLNTDENLDTSRKFGVMSIPTLIIFKNGQRVDQIVGLVPKDALRERILKHA
ncbi:MAG: thioredoxin [Thermoplasmatota archaeon]